MVNLLALDLGTNTGFCYNKGHGVKSGTITFKGDNGNWDSVEGFNKFFTFIHRIYPKQIAIEKSHVGRFLATSRIHFGMRAVAVLYSAMYKIPAPIEVSPTSIKKFWAGKGTAKKVDMLEAAKKRLKVVPEGADDNQIDAIALYHFVMEGLK